MNAAIYARVSTTEQKDKGYSLGSQVRECHAYAERNGLNVIAEIQDDISGATRLDERKGGRALLELVESAQIDAVIVYRIDRLARPPEDEMSRLLTTVEHFQRHKVTLHDCDGGPIRNDMASILITFFKGIAASQERAAIKERSMRGKREKARAGHWVGGGRTPYGYRKIGKKRDARLEINESEAAIIQRIFRLYTGHQGATPLTLNQIARLFNAEGIPSPGESTGQAARWRPETVKRSALDRRDILGEFAYQDIIINLPELAIVDEQTWQAAQVQRQSNKRRARRNRPNCLYLLSTRLKCTCGAALTGSSTNAPNGRPYRYYRCAWSRYLTKSERYCRTPIKADDIEAAVWDWLAGIIESDARLDEVIAEMADKAHNDIEPLKQEMSDIARMMRGFGDAEDAVVAAALKREINDTARVKDALERRRADIEAQIANTEISPGMIDEIKATAQLVRERVREGGTDENKRALIEALDFQGQLVEAEGNRLKLLVSCGLGNNTGEICISSQSCLQGHGQDVRPAGSGRAADDDHPQVRAGRGPLPARHLPRCAARLLHEQDPLEHDHARRQHPGG